MQLKTKATLHPILIPLTRKQREDTMEGIGSVGSAGASPAQGTACSTGTPSTGSAEAQTPVQNDTQSPNNISEQGERGGLTINIEQTQNTNMFSNMSTMDAIGLHNSSPLCESQPSSEVDLQKLIELMILMKLLQSMDESGGGGFSALG